MESARPLPEISDDPETDPAQLSSEDEGGEDDDDGEVVTESRANGDAMANLAEVHPNDEETSAVTGKKTGKKKAAKKAPAKKAVSDKPKKSDIVRGILADKDNKGKSRKDLLAMIQKQAKLSAAAASTYYYKYKTK